MSRVSSITAERDEYVLSITAERDEYDGEKFMAAKICNGFS